LWWGMLEWFYICFLVVVIELYVFVELQPATL
jgi:hypothetical protein